MKKYISIILLFLLKILGKFIPYFNHKYMALQKDTVLSSINNDVLSHLQKHSNYKSFQVVLNRLSLVSPNHHNHKVRFEIIYNNILFDIDIEYNNGVITEESSFKATSNPNTNIAVFNFDPNDLLEIGNFVNHFKSNPKANLRLFFSQLL